MKVQEISSHERVAISLKNLIDLAKPAAGLNAEFIKIQAAQSGNYVSHLKGRGMAFDETRLYQPGDDVRRIDWRVTARTDKPHCKVFKEERERPLFISVDYRATMSFATRGVFKSVQAARIAGLLAWAAQKRGDRIGGQIFGDTGCQELKPHSGKAALLHFFNALVNPVYNGQAGGQLDQVLARLKQHTHPGSQVMIISDFRGINLASERYFSALGRHCDVILVQIVDPLEMKLPAKGSYRFADNDREIMVDTGNQQLKLAYQLQFQSRQQHLQQICQKSGLTYLACATTLQVLEMVLLLRGRFIHHAGA